MDTSKGTEKINEEGEEEIIVDATNYKSSAGHEQEEPQKENVKITHVPLTYEKRGTRDSMAAKVAEKIESAKETVTGDHNKTD
ncbi:hypothetical protein K7X08_014657 [Anisodus acutangulus]|uniref:Uncharacterized protein n=1 Tax=Anisodus acutangulus TaxID=402998 RepID=A0A9Q1LIV5_9SOLA|nr:hypothetical protein K7X08_014657 [Anisodus acutangulus]